MWKALWWKELREGSLYAGLALLAQIQVLGAGMDLPLIPALGDGRQAEIPFVSYYNFDRSTNFTIIAVLTAIVLGLHQTLWESWRQTTLFLLHRPIPRQQIFLHKLAAGTVLLFAVTAIPLLIYCLWAATPGTHASPFYWSMTEKWWRSVMIAVVCYFGTFLTGLRTARWIGSRTWPAITAFVVAFLLGYPPILIPLVYLALLGLIGLLLVSILDVGQTREYP